MSDLTYFHGIGESKARSLIRLIANPPDDVDGYRRILRTPEIWPKLSEMTKADVTHHPLRYVPRVLMDCIAAEFKLRLNCRFDIAGSYLRGKPGSGDMDVVLDLDTVPVKHEQIPEWLSGLFSGPIKILPPYASGPAKIGTLLEIDLSKLQAGGIRFIAKHPEFVRLYRWNRSRKVTVKCDIFLSRASEYVFALLFATGSGLFNVRMRAAAKRQGMILNQRGLFPSKPLKTEEDIFAALGMRYVPPAERNV